MNQMKDIVNNIQRIMLSERTDLIFENSNNEGSYWSFIEAVNLLLTKGISIVNSLPSAEKEILIQIAKMLKIQNYDFLEFLKKDIQKEKKDIKISNFLLALSYLSENNSFPYEFFYNQKRYLINCIDSFADLSGVKVVNCINMLEIFTKERLFYC